MRGQRQAISGPWSRQPWKLYNTLRSMTSRSSSCAFGCGLVVNSAPTRQSGLGPHRLEVGDEVKSRGRGQKYEARNTYGRRIRGMRLE